MGLFDGILTAAAGPLVAGLFGGIGQRETNIEQTERAREQMNFQREMSSTAYQRAVSDMKAAGLNPMLAYQQGGASSQPGAMPIIGNVGAAAVQGAIGVAQRQSIENQSKLLEAQAANTEKDTELKAAQMIQQLASAGQLDAVRDNIRQDMMSFEDRWKNIRADFYKIVAETDKAAAQTMEAWERSKLAHAQTGKVPHEIALIQSQIALQQGELHQKMPAEIQKLLALAAQAKQNAQLLGLKVPEGLQEAAFWASPAGRSAVSYKHAPKNIVQTVTGAFGAASRDVQEWWGKIPKLDARPRSKRTWPNTIQN